MYILHLYIRQNGLCFMPLSAKYLMSWIANDIWD